MKKFFILLTILLLVLTSVMILVTGDRTSQRSQLASFLGKKEPAAQIGGAFSLTDSTGKAVSDTDFRGRVMMVFFGFTHCPDMCPTTMNVYTKVLSQLDETKAAQVAPILISVDPERDTPEVLAKYLTNFDKRIIGLTGTPEQVKQAAGVYRAYYAKATGAAASNDYMVDHSGYVYLMGKDGVFINAVAYDAGEQELLRQLTEALK
jgi:cytochrome oxidase Cu insertion factor (SCO1/SenC/PrrC family)